MNKLLYNCALSDLFSSSMLSHDTCYCNKETLTVVINPSFKHCIKELIEDIGQTFEIGLAHK